MDVFVNLKDLFLSVWEKGILGINFFGNTNRNRNFSIIFNF